MFKTSNLKLPILAQAQAQKHVTVNETFVRLDGLVQCTVIDLLRDAPPAEPGEGERYVTGAAPTGEWAGEPRRLAFFLNGGWLFLEPKPGWRVYNLADDTLYVLNSALAWVALSGSGGGGSVSEIQNASLIGLGTTADPANPLTAKLNSALFTARTAAEGGNGNLYLTLNKSATAGDLGYAFQTGFVTRALAGLFGSDRFRIAVSANGSDFRDGLAIDEASGIVDQPHLPRFKAYTNFDNYVAVNAWAKIAINAIDYDDQATFEAATSVFTAPVAGTYMFGASLIFRMNTSAEARMRGRLVLNGSTEIRGSFGENSGPHVSQATALWLQTLTPLAAGDTVELQGYFRGQDGFFAANRTTFWGYKVG